MYQGDGLLNSCHCHVPVCIRKADGQVRVTGAVGGVAAGGVSWSSLLQVLEEGSRAGKLSVAFR